MKKSTFAAILSGVISCMFLGLGMCMTMLLEWNAFRPGMIVGCAGLVIALITVFVWRKMEHREPVKMNGKTILTVLVGIAGALILGTGMCMVMVWSSMILGIVLGMIGIIILLCLIPLRVGLK